MSIVHTDTGYGDLRLVTELYDDTHNQQARILTALGLVGGGLPEVDDTNLRSYYRHLSENMTLPLTAHYPSEPTSLEEAETRCSVVELLNPDTHLGDEFDGILCKTRKGHFEVNLPLVELEISDDDPNFQLIEDYWYWFWNWRVA